MALSTVATSLTRSPLSLRSSFLRHSHHTLSLLNFSFSPLSLTRFSSHYRRRSLKTMASMPEATSTAPYGSWKSPITADVISGGEKRLGGIAVDGHGRLIWLESRPTEGGQCVLVKEAENLGMAPVDIISKKFSVRTRAQEYGGGAFAVSGDTVVFSNYKDQRLYLQSLASGEASPSPITPDYGGPTVCYADGVFDPRFPRFITVMEDQRQSNLNPIATIASISLGGGDIQEPKILVGGNDFYAFPRMDSEGERMAWIEWGHPNMPWDRSELWVGYMSEDGDVYKRICVAGGDPALIESPTEPKWTPEGISSGGASSLINFRQYSATDAVWSVVFLTNVRRAVWCWWAGIGGKSFKSTHKQIGYRLCSHCHHRWTPPPSPISHSHSTHKKLNSAPPKDTSIRVILFGNQHLLFSVPPISPTSIVPSSTEPPPCPPPDDNINKVMIPRYMLRSNSLSSSLVFTHLFPTL